MNLKKKEIKARDPMIKKQGMSVRFFMIKVT